MGNRKITSTLKSGTWFKRQKKKKGLLPNAPVSNYILKEIMD